MKKTRPFGWRDLTGYAMGDFACNMSFALITNYMMLYYTQYIGVKLTDWAWIVIVGKVWDAINDPIIGGLVDRVHIGKGSKFMPWITIGAAALIVTTTLVYLPIASAPYTFKMLYCLIVYMIWSIAYTMANVPYGALHSVITDDEGKRTTLSTFRSIGAGFAQGGIMVLPMLVYGENNELLGNRFIWVGLGCAIVGFIGFMLVRLLVTERVEIVETKKEKFNYFSTIKSFFTNRPLMAITIITFAQIICFMSMTSVNTIVFQTYFHNTKMITVASFIMYIPMVVLIPFIGAITRKFGKRLFVSVAALVGVAAGIVMCFLPLQPDKSSSIAIWLIGLMLLYLNFASLQILVWAIVADCIAFQNKKTGEHEEGSVYALYSFFRKLAQGVGSSLCALALAACGYVEELGADQTLAVATNIKNMYIWVSLAGALITMLVMFFMYNLKDTGNDTAK